ncbi:cobalamin-binding protein [Shewanella livingstonensis]|uniref:Cobalamin-binding protein n=1 Tax=Shewanella livingstonensis TaxID=150120 RepID=A0A3G8LVX0_9GAMM|nr:cobalamin-binding protein [Shewanella livingstonensis]AZG73295.1 cobalamin-binding protein [Shewanella livingstonensis]
MMQMTYKHKWQLNPIFMVIFQLTSIILLLTLSSLTFAAETHVIELLDLSNTPTHKTVNSIVALSPHSVELLYEIGVGNKIIATVDYADFPEEAKNIKRIGHSDFIDMEALLVLNPDLVVLSFEDTSQPLIDQLNNLHLPLLDTSVSKLDDIADKLEELGAATGHFEVGKQKAQVFRHTLKQLRERYSHKTPVKVFYQIWPEPLTTVSGGWMNDLLTDCGAINIFANGVAAYPQVSMEQVLVRMPELILKPHYHGNSNQESIDWSMWNEIPAVANQQIQLIKGDLVHRTGPRVVKGMAKVCELVDAAREQRAAL